MKKEIHPKNFRQVIFHDNTSGARFLIASTVETEEHDKWEDGKAYPLFRVEISSASHPFYTGRETVIDTAGRVDRFKRRVATSQVKKEEKKKIVTLRASRMKEKKEKKESGKHKK